MRLVFFFADYCGLCHAMREHVIDPLASCGADVEIVNAVERPFYADSFRVSRLPTAVVLDEDGDEYARYTDMFTIGVLEGDLGL